MTIEQLALEKERKAELYRACKRLKDNEDWQELVKDLRLEIENHTKQSIIYLAKNKIKEAQEQAWFIEGIEKCIDRLDCIIQREESPTNQVRQKYLTPILDKFRKKVA